MTSFAHMATVTASTKRIPAISSGKRGTPVTNIASLKCTPLDPIGTQPGAEVTRNPTLGTPGNVLETFVDATVDIVAGDRLVVGTREYPVRVVEDWTWLGGTYRRVVVDNLKTV